MIAWKMVSSVDDDKYTKLAYILDVKTVGHADGLIMGLEGNKKKQLE